MLLILCDFAVAHMLSFTQSSLSYFICRQATHQHQQRLSKDSTQTPCSQTGCSFEFFVVFIRACSSYNCNSMAAFVYSQNKVRLAQPLPRMRILRFEDNTIEIQLSNDNLLSLYSAAISHAKLIHASKSYETIPAANFPFEL